MCIQASQKKKKNHLSAFSIMSVQLCIEKYIRQDFNDNGNTDIFLQYNWYCMEPWQRK